MPRSASVRRAGFSLIELLVVVAVLLTILAIAIPNLLRARTNANEASAVAALRSIATAEVSYQTQFQQGYAPSLAALGPPPAPPPNAAGADLIDPVLALGAKSGYVFLYATTDTNGDGQPDAYTVNANPQVPGQTGTKYFYLDQSNTIRFSTTGPATSASQPIPPF